MHTDSVGLHVTVGSELLEQHFHVRVLYGRSLNSFRLCFSALYC